MYIIDETYFNGGFEVPNVLELNSDAKENLDAIVNDKARLFLQEALGYTEFEDLDQYVIDGVFLEEIITGTELSQVITPTPQKWLDFVNGKEYTLNGNTYKWQGLIYLQGSLKKSILTNFCYYYWLEERQSQMSGVGEVVLDAKNANRVNSTQRLVRVWNEFVDKNQKQCNSILNGAVSFVRGVRFTDYYSQNTSRYVSLVKYLEDNQEVYPSANPRLYETKNQLGI